MVAASGDRLIAEEAVGTLRAVLIPKADLITPNLPEAAVLLDTAPATSEDAMREQAQRLLALGPRAVLIKGGHGDGAESVDILIDATGFMRLAGPRIATRNTHGTGCTLSSAIAAGLAKGRTLREAVEDAKSYIGAAIAAADRLDVGHGHGPVHHFHAWW